MKMTSNERPVTPPPKRIRKCPDTVERASFFWHVDNARDDENLVSIASQHRIARATAYRWLREREELGTERRTRKMKAKLRGHKLGRPFQIPQKTLDAIVGPA
jgi:hypothetical protein